MDEARADEIRRRLVIEKARNGYPDGFPRLPEIPVGRYVDPELYQLEIDRVWKRTWLHAAHISEFPETGSYKVLDLPFAPTIILVRGDDGVVRAFLNVCRHRGSPVMQQECGRANHLRCPFHGWSWDLRGELAYVKDARDFKDLDRRGLGLGSVRCEAAGGFLFVNLDDDAIPLEEYLRPVWPYISQIFTADLRYLGKSTHDVDCNWKLMADGTLEFYHGSTIHGPTVGRFLDFDATVIELYDRGHCSLTSAYDKKLLEGVIKNPAWDQTAWKEGDHVPAGIPRIPNINDIWYRAMPSFYLFPNNEMALESSSFAFYMIFPRGLKSCRMQLDHFATPWGDGPRPTDYDVRMQAFERLNKEDIDNMKIMQRSVDAAAEKGYNFPLSYQERRIYHVHNWVDRMIGPENIRPELRVPSILDGHIDR